MDYVLFKEQQEEFIKLLIDAKECEESEMRELIDGCIHFVHKVHGNSYFLSKSNETTMRKGMIQDNYVSDVYNLTDKYYFFIEEISVDFVDFILQNYSNSEISIDQDITHLHYSFLTRYE